MLLLLISRSRCKSVLLVRICLLVVNFTGMVLLNGLLIHHSALLLRVGLGHTCVVSELRTVFHFSLHLCHCAGEAEARGLLRY